MDTFSCPLRCLLWIGLTVLKVLKLTQQGLEKCDSESMGLLPGGGGGGGGGGGVLDISSGGEVRPDPSYLERQKSLIFLPCLRQNYDF